nr:hypothetical protein GCM10020093_053230 [Planobispora longispora]
MPRLAPCIRTYRPVPETARSSVPPSPEAVEKTSLHEEPSAEVWILYEVAWAASQVSLTRLMVCADPRSTWIHSGSCPSWLAHRVEALPSTALPASSPLASTDEAVTGLPRDTSGSAAAAGHWPRRRGRGQQCHRHRAESREGLRGGASLHERLRSFRAAHRRPVPSDS